MPAREVPGGVGETGSTGPNGISPRGSGGRMRWATASTQDASSGSSWAGRWPGARSQPWVRTSCTYPERAMGSTASPSPPSPTTAIRFRPPTTWLIRARTSSSGHAVSRVSWPGGWRSHPGPSTGTPRRRRRLGSLFMPNEAVVAASGSCRATGRARWMRAPEPVGHLGALQVAVFTGRRLRLRYRGSGQGSASERGVDPYGLVCKAGIWYLVADSGGEPRLLRLSRVVSAVADQAPVRRRDGVELAGLWASLRREVEDRPPRWRLWCGCGGGGWTCSAGCAG